jgi:hypothetical protein
MIIADAVFNRLKSTNIRECVRLARLTRSDSNLARLERIIETFVKYATSTFDDKTRKTIWIKRLTSFWSSLELS